MIFFCVGSGVVITPSLSKDELNKLNVKYLGPVEFCHFEGQNKSVPPDIRVHQALPFTFYCNNYMSIFHLQLIWILPGYTVKKGVLRYTLPWCFGTLSYTLV